MIHFANLLKIPDFRGVFMRNALPSTKPFINESAILNLSAKSGGGTHWTCYRKNGQKVWYFDSFGNVKPPKELFEYLKVPQIYYNYDRYQNFNTFVCGHLCLKFLYNGLPLQN